MRSLNGTTEGSHHGKSRKSHRVALGIAEKLGGRRAKRSQRSAQDPAQYSLTLRRGDDRGSREWKDHELPAQFKREFGIGRRSRRQEIILHQFVRKNAETIDRGCFDAENNWSERDRQTAVGFGQA